MRENKSLKNSYESSFFNDNLKDNIPAYNDSVLQDKVEETKKSKERRKQEKKLKKEQLAKEKYKNSLNKFSEMDEYLLFVMGIGLIALICSVATLKITYIFDYLCLIIFTYFVARRLKPITDENGVLEILIWNLSSSVDDFFEYKIKFDMKSDYINDISKYSTLFVLAVVLFNSNSILYIASLIMLIISFLVAFACKDASAIREKKSLILLGLIGGFIFKGVLHSIIGLNLTLDLTNLILAVAFSCLFHFFTYVEVSEPSNE